MVWFLCLPTVPLILAQLNLMLSMFGEFPKAGDKPHNHLVLPFDSPARYGEGLKQWPGTDFADDWFYDWAS